MQIVTVKFSLVFTNAIPGWYPKATFTQTQWKLHINHNVWIRTRAGIFYRNLWEIALIKNWWRWLKLLLLWDPGTVHSSTPAHCLKQTRFLFFKGSNIREKLNLKKKKPLREIVETCSCAGQRAQRAHLTALLHCKTPQNMQFQIQLMQPNFKVCLFKRSRELFSVKLFFPKGFCSSFLCFYTHFS